MKTICMHNMWGRGEVVFLKTNVVLDGCTSRGYEAQQTGEGLNKSKSSVIYPMNSRHDPIPEQLEPV